MSLFNKRLPTQKSELFAAIDIGSNKICCAIAKVADAKYSDKPSLRVIGLGYQLSKGLRGGNIIDLDALEDSVLNAVHVAEQSAGQNINSAYIGVPSRWTKSTHVKLNIPLNNQAVDESHIKRLLNLGKQYNISKDQHVMHIMPIGYAIDDISGIRDPKGMVGNTLSVVLHVITVPVGMMRNLSTCIGRCHLDVAGFVSSAYASGLASLVDDETELGVTMIDIGAGQTSISTFVEGNLTSICSIPIGGANITNDIARGLATPISQAERLKNLYGTLIQSSTDDRENIMVAQMGESNSNYTHQIPKGMLVHIIKSRVEELFEWVGRKIENREIDPVAFQRIVLTGGVSQLQGIRELAQHMLTRPVRLGSPTGVSGAFELINDPTFTTCAGILQYALQDFESNLAYKATTNKTPVFKTMNGWFKKNF